ncbi:DUF4037 domain-containing protein [Dactylosporangium sp. CA-092794]|uniref:DUF4037 domain-containing protein n=1 Tax=Dactylosporangium sp. CA-092794 TaxID=3239929 RepID=UPI003D94148C
MAAFRPGVEVCRALYTTAVRPLLDAHHPGLPHAAARIGPGSDVLGYDTPRSTDHDWGPQLTLLLSAPDLAAHGDAIRALLAERLPTAVLGHSTHFLPPSGRVRVMTPVTTGPVAHRVEVTTLAGWATAHFADCSDVAGTSFWLRTPAQRLAEAVGGAVFHDTTGELTALRQRLAWYPGPVWRYVLAAEWTHIAQEEAFPGRALEAGDETGSLIVAARLARHVMRLALLLRRRYPPYSKWLGTAFARLGFPAGLAGIAAPDTRLDVLCTAYETLGRWQNDLGLCEPVPPTRRLYHDRPYQVIDATRFAAALWPAGVALGAVDQVADSTDVLMSPPLCAAVASAVRGQAGQHPPGGLP